MLIPTDGGLRPGDAKWQPMCDWLAANMFNLDNVPCDAWICIRDETCLGVEHYVRDLAGKCVPNEARTDAVRRVEWHPMVEPPPAVLLP